MSAVADPNWAANQAARLEAKLREFVGYLREHGVTFEPVGPADLVGPETGARIPPALVDAHMLAAQSLVNEVAAAHEQPGELSKMLAEWRLEVIETLWLHYRWHEPWISLVNQEFPGPEPSADDVLAFEAKRAQVESSPSDAERVNELALEIELLLQDPTLNDDLAVTSLAMLLYFGTMTQTLAGVASPEALIRRHMTAREIIERSEQPDHPNWKAVLVQYFPIPE